MLDTHLTRDRPDDWLSTVTRRHVVLGFRTADGQDIRVKDTTGVPRVDGDRVTVRYLPSRMPTDPGTWPYRPARPNVSGSGTPGAGADGLRDCTLSTGPDRPPVERAADALQRRPGRWSGVPTAVRRPACHCLSVLLPFCIELSVSVRFHPFGAIRQADAP
ncbi:hypothetical protein [Kitasatospora griseola]|uniref:hypothetical protein n=1 Tax=Kitasatospora griseola TaxID=2064 RepID=UPI003803674E